MEEMKNTHQNLVGRVIDAKLGVSVTCIAGLRQHMDRTAEFLALVREYADDAQCQNVSAESTLKANSVASKVMKKLSVLLLGIAKTEARLNEVAVEYAALSFTLERDGDAGDRMKDDERDSIEAQVTGFLVECRAALDEISRETSGGPQLAAFETGALRIALDRTKNLSAIFNKLQQLRYHRDLKRRQSSVPAATSTDDAWKRCYVEETKSALPAASPSTEPPDRKSDDVLPQFQLAILQREREVLASQIERDLDAAKRIESRMHQISQLMSTFSALVSEQQETIASLFETVEETVDVVDRSNEQLQRAARRSSIFPSFFNALVLAASFILMVLHWFNP